MKRIVLISIMAALALGGCASPKPAVAPDMTALGGNVASATASVKAAKTITGGVAKALVLMNRANANDPAFVQLKLDVDTLDAKLTSALADLDVANLEVVKVNKKVVAVTKERNDFQRAAINERVVTKYVMFLIAALSVAFFFSGQILIKLYAAQVTAYVPFLGSIASDILSYVAGFTAFAVFLLAMLALQRPLMWLVQAVIWIML